MRPLRWTPDQWGSDFNRNRRGGFFGLYVVFNLLLLLGLVFREGIQNKYLLIKKNSNENSVPVSEEHSPVAKVALLSVIAMSIVPLNFPQSHELRYFMYWMMCLVSLNLYLISLPKNRQLWGRWLKPKYMGLIYTMFLMVVMVKTNWFFVKPSLITLDQYVGFGVKQDYLNQIQPNDRVCLVSRHLGEDVQLSPSVALKYAFVYSSYFHPELDYDYGVQAALTPDACGDRQIIGKVVP